MTAFTLGEATAMALARVSTRRRPPARSGAPHPTGARVRRDSIEAGTFEEAFFAAPARGETDRLIRAARAALDAGRRVKRAARGEGRALSAAERALAAMTAGAVRVYEELCTLARLNRGRVYPSYDHLAQATALGRATVARALHVLEDAGFLVRQRRFARVEGAKEQGVPQWAQTSNAYRATWPARLAALLPCWLRPSPMPDCAVQHAADRAWDMAEMRHGMSCREIAETRVGGALGRVLAKLGAALDRRDDAERESHDDPQPLLDSFERSSNDVGLVGQRRSA